jgi:uncharacterized protein YecA (UPF0149 family)
MKDINETLAQGKIPVLPKNVGKKIQRNDKCECGSDKKYKKCCLGGVKNV